MRMIHALLAAAAIVAPLTAAEAGLLTRTLTPEETAFSHCDGYGTPSKKSDGLTTGSWLFGLASTTVDERRAKLNLGLAQVAECDTALSAQLLQPQFAMRRAHLLQAKAIHQIAGGKFEDALQTLAQSDAAGASEPLFQDSIGQGNRALRALADHGLGRKAEAEAALADLERRRPYATSQQQLALRVRLQFEDSRTAQMALLKRLAATFTPARKQLFWLSMLYRDFSGALTYAPGISFDDPRSHGSWYMEGGEFEKYRDVLERAEFAGAVAYAETATGSPKVAAQTLAQLHADLQQWMQPPPPPAPDSQWSKKVREDYELRKLSGEKALALIKRWEDNIALREQAKTVTIGDLPKAIEAAGSKPAVPGDLIAIARTPEPKDSALQRQLLDLVDADLDKERLKAMHMDFQDLVGLLPRPETLATRPRWQTEGDGFWRNDLNGFAVKPNATVGSFTVRFGTATGSLAMADEGAMLAAAYDAVKQGKDAFVVDVRQPVQRTIHMIGMYGRSSMGDTPSGYEVRMIVRPVSLSSVAAADHDRAIPAREVIAALGPKFVAPAQ